MAGLRAIRGEVIIGKRLAGRARCSASAWACRCCSPTGPSTASGPPAAASCPAWWSRLDAAGAAAHGLEHGPPAGRLGLFAGTGPDDRFYFVHSYAARSLPGGRTPPPLLTWPRTGRFVAAVEDGPLCATQFHPEKSGDAGAAAAGELAGADPMTRPESGALTLLPAVDVAGGQAVRLVQGDAGTETGYGDPLDAALAWQRAGRAVDSPGRPRRRLRPRIERATARVDRPAARRRSGAVRRHPRRRLAGRGARDRMPAGHHRHRRAGESGLGRATLSHEHGDRIAVGLDVRGTTAGRARLDLATAASCWPCWPGWTPAGAARYVVTDVTKDGMLTGPNLDLLRQVCAAHRPAGDRQRGGFQPRRPGRDRVACGRSAWREPSSARRCTRARSPWSRRSRR